MNLELKAANPSTADTKPSHPEDLLQVLLDPAWSGHPRFSNLAFVSCEPEWGLSADRYGGSLIWECIDAVQPITGGPHNHGLIGGGAGGWTKTQTIFDELSHPPAYTV